MRTATHHARRTASVIVALGVVSVAWAIGMPPATGADEPAHVYRAVSLWRGQFLPESQWSDGSWLVRVPERIAQVSGSVECLKFKPEIPADCMEAGAAAAGTDRMVTVTTGAGRYLPPYYYVVGWPSRFSDGVPLYWAMRLTSAAVCIGMLFWATVLLRGVLRPRLRAAAMLLAITPQVTWLMATVNPNSWEIAGGVLAWAAGLAYLRQPGPVTARSASPTVFWGFLTGATVMLLTRRLSPLWLTLIVVSLLLTWRCLPHAERRERLTPTRAGILPALWLGLLMVGSAVWHALLDLGPALSVLTPDPRLEQLSFVERALSSLPHVPRWIWQTYGVMGWLDTRSPAPAMAVWLLAVGAVAVASVGRRTRWSALTLMVVAGSGAFVLPLLVEAAAGSTTGSRVWQGRYEMPLTQGLLIALVVVATAFRSSPAARDRDDRLADIATAVLTLGACMTFVKALHRYTDGLSNDWDLVSPRWSPPLGVGLLDVLACCGLVMLAICLRLGTQPRPSPVGVQQSTVDVQRTQLEPLGAER